MQDENNGASSANENPINAAVLVFALAACASSSGVVKVGPDINEYLNLCRDQAMKIKQTNSENAKKGHDQRKAKEIELDDSQDF